MMASDVARCRFGGVDIALGSCTELWHACRVALSEISCGGLVLGWFDFPSLNLHICLDSFIQRCLNN